MSAAVKRAISAALDRIRAEKTRDDAADEYRVRTEIERAAVAALSEDELYEYRVGLTNALADQQIAAAPH